MPQRKAQNPRDIVLAIRLTRSERQEISRQAGNTPLGAWIRQRALACPEMPRSPTSPTVQPELLSQPTLEGGVPAPLPGEGYSDYQRRLDFWAMEALSDKAQRARLEIATRIGVSYARTGYHQPSKT